MRTLKFIVKDQIIEKDPDCDFSNLVPGTEGYLRAEFSFSPEWEEYAKVAAFYSLLGTEYPPTILENGRYCMIPAEALKRRIFKIQVFGKNSYDKVLSTNKLIINQDGGKT
jgi:hypothetical protein